MISSAEQLRILNDVVRRYPKVRIADWHGQIIFPVYGRDGALTAKACAVAYSGDMPDLKKSPDLDLSPVNTVLTYDGGQCICMEWPLVITGDDLYRLLDAAAKSLSS